MTVETAGVAAAAVLGLMLVVWVVSLVAPDASIVDIAWGFGFVVVGWTVAVASQMAAGRSGLVVALVSVWGVRLTVYLAWRNIGKGEDYRYVAMRRRWGRRFPWVSLGTVFLTQGALMWVVSLPVQAAVAAGGRIGPVDVAGAFVFLVGLTFEAVGDAQLARFKRTPGSETAVMDRGLWRYTRHPNYFGDFLVWWGLYLVALAAGAWWTVVGPVVMTGLLMRYSGVGLLERTIGSRRPGYAEYVRRTNPFFPGPPR